MDNCSLCGKKAVMISRVGNLGICNKCSIKSGAALWMNRKYSSYEEIQKQKEKAVKAFRKNSYPEDIIYELELFFQSKAGNLSKCEVCGKTVKNSRTIVWKKLCAECYSLIDVEDWKKNDFSDNGEVEISRQAILAIADRNHFPEAVKEDINKYFDGKIEEGLVRSIAGGQGQRLKVYEDCCIIKTGLEFDDGRVSKLYDKLISKNEGNPTRSNSVAKTIVRGIIFGNVVRTGINMAASSAVDKITGAKTSEMANVIKGEIKLDYRQYTRINYQRVTELGNKDKLGYLSFTNGQDDQIMYFFSDDSYMEDMYSYICGKIDDIVKEKERDMVRPQISVADELLKFKQLLDMGVLTPEEFEEQKRILLNK